VLVFTRKRGDAIVIGDGIEVRVLAASRDGVKLGVSAPASVAVHRREIYDIIRAENASAARRPGELQELMHRLRAPKP
jgi:carbon storage regulator